jgi:hypothetical protein
VKYQDTVAVPWHSSTKGQRRLAGTGNPTQRLRAPAEFKTHVFQVVLSRATHANDAVNTLFCRFAPDTPDTSTRQLRSELLHSRAIGAKPVRMAGRRVKVSRRLEELGRSARGHKAKWLRLQTTRGPSRGTVPPGGAESNAGCENRVAAEPDLTLIDLAFQPCSAQHHISLFVRE